MNLTKELMKLMAILLYWIPLKEVFIIRPKQAN